MRLSLLVLGTLVTAVGWTQQQPAPDQQGQRGGGRGAPPPMVVNFDDHAGFVQIFDGKSLNGWEGSPEVWRVEDSAIVADNTPEKPVAGTTFIFFKDTEINDFELKLELKVEGGGNSGIQYRSRNVEPSANFGRGAGPGGAGPGGPPGAPPNTAPPTQTPPAAASSQPVAPDPNADPCSPGARGRGPGGFGGPGGPGGQRPGGPGGMPLGGPYAKWNLQGYQFDTDSNGCMAGQLFEGGRFPGERGITTRPGQVVLLREGQPNALLATIATPEDIRSTFKRGDWNQYHVVVRGNTFMHILNGRVTSVTIDDDASKRQQKGVIGIQLEGARRVAFRNVWLKKL